MTTVEQDITQLMAEENSKQAATQQAEKEEMDRQEEPNLLVSLYARDKMTKNRGKPAHPTISNYL